MNHSTAIIMGILNLTPDSFSDGGQYNTPEKAIERIHELIKDGADIIDIGAESTGPGSEDVSAEDELSRLKAVVELGLPKGPLYSIDTYKAAVAEYALENGFQMVNDVTALRGDPSMIGVLLKYQPEVVLMYSKDPTPRTTKDLIHYEDVMGTIMDFLVERSELLLEADFPPEKIILDPGMGAFVSGIPEYSFEIIQRLPELKDLGHRILIGISRKSCLGGGLKDRDKASVEWSLKAAEKGADIIRIHDVSLLRKALTSRS
jgi:dihydropteroate synthase